MTRVVTPLVFVLLAFAACSEDGPPPRPTGAVAASPPLGAAVATTGEADSRRAAVMVDEQLATRDIDDPRVLAAMRRVPRHRFVPEAYQPYAYDDRPLPIGYEQTISQPYIVGIMSQLAEIEPGDRVLEIGTGSGYQAAVLAELGAEVYSIEIVEPLGLRAASVLSELGYQSVHTRIGDGYAGWPEEAPFDAVILTAAPREVPRPLLEQLAVGGRFVGPIGRGPQELLVITRTETGYERQNVLPVIFVPMTGRAQH